MRTINRIRSTGIAALGAGLIALLCGCSGEKGPKTYPVRGKIVVKNGDAAQLVGGFVRFQSVKDKAIIGVGEIDEGGTFGLGTFVDGQPRGGLLEGEYMARIEPPGSEDREEGDPPPRAKKGSVLAKYLDYNKSGLKYTIQPGDNDITIEVEARK